ncbi:MAG: hypothetical protein KC613_10175 [Myxococcales bacterium]|nr:hypothetical protein [Myxococcales bacterium]MCB9525187.1 hypothetical protein [Myxococcales bacterium]
MDIFRWIYDDRMDALLEEAPRLAYIMHRLPTAAVDNRHAEVDALAAEGLVLARQRKDPWIEVFVRHWRLQSTVFKRLEVKDSLREAVDLVERAHRPDAIGCPQSTCATQDLCAAYGRADGPAYVAERLAASEGTLARIDPTWPCWRCITAEYAGALVDDGRYAEALAWLEANLAKMRRVRPKANRDEYCGTWVECLVGLGRLDEAMTLSRTAKNDGQGEHFVQERAIEQAWIHLKAERHAEAAEALPAASLVRDTPDYFDKWAEVACGLVLAGARELDVELLRDLLAMARGLRESGAVWLAFRVAQRAVQALLAGGWLPAADALLEELHAVATERVRPAESLAAVAELRAAWDTLAAERPDPLNPADREATLARFAAEGSAFSERLAALAAWPDAVENVHAVVGFWDHLGFPARAEQTLRAHLGHAPADDTSLLARLGERLADEGRFPALAALVAEHAGPDAPEERTRVGRWLQAKAASRQGRLEEAVDLLDGLVREEPGRMGLRRQLADWLKTLGRLAEAQAQLEALIAGGEPPGSVDWDRMVLATRRGDWAAVRASGARLGMQFDAAEGPIDEAWEYVRVRFPGEGPEALYLAGRTGPVTARVLQPAVPGQVNHEEDLVVFDARPLNPDVGGERPVYEYAVDAVLEAQGRLAYAVDGAHPGKPAIEAARAALKDVGGRLHVLSGDRYTLSPAEDAELPGLYGVVTAPPDVDRAALGARLGAAWADTDMTWLSLLDEAADPAEVARQERLAEHLEL